MKHDDCNHICKENTPIIYWNPFNEVFQCHRCGEVFAPRSDNFVRVAEASLVDGKVTTALLLLPDGTTVRMVPDAN